MRIRDQSVLDILHLVLCKLGIHKKYIDEMGGVIFEACEKCNWVGKQKDYRNEKN